MGYITGPGGSVTNCEGIHFTCPHCGTSNIVWIDPNGQVESSYGQCDECWKSISVQTSYGKITEVRK